ncbi:MAG TPA: shikimate kinase [Terriglobales bacterium]|nr:shikimate kinase [Terriglobales bacterium]
MTPSRALFLTGFMGAGKTSVGAALARRRGCAFYDLDALIVERAGKSVAEIFATSGETGFREAESAALRDLLAQLAGGAAVVALGGGSLLSPGNAQAVRAAGGVVIALDAPLDVLLARTRAARGTRPLAEDEAGFRQLYAARRPQYLAADVVVESGSGGVEDVAQQVERSISALVGDRREK